MNVKRHLTVLMDTCAIVPSTGFHLVSTEARETITRLATDSDFSVEWVLPKTVVDERRYRLQQKADSLAAKARALEAVLANPLPLGPESLREGLDRLIVEQATALNLTIAVLDPGQVDWMAIVRGAVERTPPFEPDKEKGFRDAVIGETCLQVIGTIPDDLSRGAVFMVTGDQLLTAMMKARTAGRSDIVLVDSLSAMSGRVEELRARINSELADRIRVAAERFFFERPDGLAEKSGALDQLFAKVRVAMQLRPLGSEWTKIDNVAGATSQFLRRSGSRSWWAESIEFAVSAWRKGVDYAALGRFLAGGLGPLASYGLANQWRAVPGAAYGTTLPTPASASPLSDYPSVPSGTESEYLKQPPVPDYCVTRGRVLGVITWSADVTGEGSLTDGRVDSIEAKAPEWDA